MRFTLRALVVVMSWVAIANAAGEPGWVNRGSAAVKNGDNRVFYGVGSASGIKNAPLLRTTADNRARSELGKIFETFSASLMHDYASSSGEQAVEQAVKTFSAMSLEGVEVVDRYIAADGTMWSLAALDTDKMVAAIQKAKAQGIVKSSVTPVTVDDMFDKHAKKVDAPKPAMASSGNDTAPTGGNDKAPKEATSGANLTKGGKPAWVEGNDPHYPVAAFLCGVGFSPKRDGAENSAYAALAKIFVANVQQSSRDFMGAYAKTGAPNLEIQASETLTQVSTQKIMSGVRIPEVWQDKDIIFALACLERAKAGAALRDQIRDLDGKADASIKRAEGLDPQGKLRELARALDALVQREALNAELRIVDAEGVGVPSPYAPYDVSSQLEAAQDQLLVGVSADGPYASDFRGAIIEALTKKGYKVSEVGGSAGGLDVLVAATIRIEDGGAGTGAMAAMHFARGVVQVELKNVKQGKVIGSFNESKKEGHRSMEEAERKVVRELAQKLSGPVGSKIDDTMKGK